MKMCLQFSGIGYDARHPKYLTELYSASEWEDWRAFNRLFPFGQDQIHMMLARLTAWFYNANRPKGAAAISPEELIPRVDIEEVWREIDAQIEEKRRLDAMTPAQRTAEAKERLKREHAARMKAVKRRQEQKQKRIDAGLKRRESKPKPPLKARARRITRPAKRKRK